MMRFIAWTLLILALVFIGLPVFLGLVGTALAVANAMLSATLGVLGIQHPFFSTRWIGHMTHGIMPFGFHFRLGLVETLILIGAVILIVRLATGSRRRAGPAAGPAPTSIPEAQTGYERTTKRAGEALRRLTNAERHAFGETSDAERVREMEKGFERMTKRLEALETILVEERERRRD